MRRKGFIKRGICLAVAMAMLSMTACGTAKEAGADNTTYEEAVSQAEEASVEQGAQNQVASSDAEAIDMIKAKYQAASADYSGNVIEVERDEPIELQLGFNPWDLEDSLKGSIKIYQDAEMTQPIDLFGDDYDAETGTLKIYPPTFGIGEMFKDDDVDDLSGSYIYDPDEEYELDLDDPNYDVHHGNGWGTLPQYYMVTTVDLETGEKLEKPEITVIKIKSEISKAPQMKFTQTEKGEAKFYWQPVEGATEYLVFKIYNWGGESGLHEYVYVVGRTTDCEWICESTISEVTQEFGMEGEVGGLMNETFSEVYEQEVDMDYCYGVLAVNKNGASPMSNLMDEDDLCHMLPYSIQHLENDYSVDTTSELPATAGITMCDGTTAQKILEYDFDSVEKISGLEHAYQLTAKVDGTMYVVSYSVYNQDWDTFEAEKAAIEERQAGLRNKGGDVSPSNDYDDTKETPETEAEDKKTEEAAETESEDKKEEKATETESEDKKEEVTETESEDKKAEEASETESEAAGDDKKVNKPSEMDLESNVTASSALSEYLARNLLVTNSAIDVSAFPEAVDWNVLEDAFCEAYYQNPLILGINRYGADLENGMFYVEYQDDAETVAAKQQEIISKVNEVVGEIITDDMTDWEKGYAINQYLCENAEYDNAALESAEENNFETIDEKYNDSFTAYGCLVKGIGVCASYSADYKLLADAAGLESIVVTGYLDGTYAHAWNKVNIDGNWYIVDSTNNDKEVAANALLNLSDSASDTTLVEDERFVIDETISGYAANYDDMEYYRVINKFFEQDEISEKLAAELKENKYSVLRTDYDLNDEEFASILNETANDAQMSVQGAYWMGIVVMQEY